MDKTRMKVPIIQAGMAGGITTPELVAAVANKGALGTIGAGYMSASVLQKEIQQVKNLTDKPFAVNLFATNLEAFSTDTREMQMVLNQFRDELDIDRGSDSVKVYDYLEEKIYIILQENIPIVSTAFGALSSVLIDRLKEKDVTLIGMATNISEAKMLAESGYDVIVAQGFEAGGHRGTFDIRKHPDGCNIGLHVLLQEMVDEISLPVIAAGGIHTKEQIHALLSMGAAGVQLGTRFLIAKEAGTNTAYRRALMKAETEGTVITKVFSGRPARAIQNCFVKEVEKSNCPVLPFPVQNELTKDIRAAGKDFAISDMQSLWAGQGVGAICEEESLEKIMNSLTKGFSEKVPLTDE
ncbi:NAD(P)H-dependent flavin oxidoreductase [Virgibacillus byunsanensis]|uniref:Probable nitronate monooxygenase n=1 Tax=Virgibacillus byunsanensis TaxID=570945 RepID=A0ABW3LGP9_9BACI